MPGINELFAALQAAKTPDDLASCQAELFRDIRAFANSVCYITIHESIREFGDDVAREAMTKLSEFKEDSSFKTWVYAIAERRAIDALRQRINGRERVADLPAEHYLEFQEADGHGQDPVPEVEARIALSEAAEHLSPERRILWDAIVQGRSRSEIASLLGITEDAVDGRKRRLFDEMQEILRS